MAASLVQQLNTGIAEGSVSTLTLSSVVMTGGNTIIAFAADTDDGSQPTGVSDGVNTYNAKVTGSLIRAYVAENISGGTRDITVTWSAASGFRFFVILEYTGVAAASYDASNHSSGTGTAISTGSITTAGAGVLVYIATRSGYPNTYTVGTDFTLIDGDLPDAVGATRYTAGVEERITTGALSGYTATITGSNSADWWAVWVSLLEASGAAAPRRASSLATLGVT